MAMILVGFLVGYTVLTLPLLVWAAASVVLKRRAKRASSDLLLDKTVPELERMLVDSFKSKGINAKVHTIPTNPTEAIISESHRITGEIAATEKNLVHWFSHMNSKADQNKRDIDLLMVSTTKIVDAVNHTMDRVERRETPAAKVESFVHSLEYAKEKFAKTPTQKKALGEIISNIETQHGTSK